MGTATVRSLSDEDLRAELTALIERLGMPLEQARALENSGALTPEQYEALGRIADTEWLLGTHE